MPRSKDLDDIAPDENTPTPPNTPPKTPSDTSVPKNPPSEEPPKSPPQKSASVDQKFRQKVYELIKGKTANSFSAFLARPKVFTFDAREEDEEIILVLRRHWFTNLGWILVALLMFAAPSLLTLVPLLSSFPANYQFVFIVFWYLISFAIAFEQFLSWYFNVFIITEERVYDIDMFNLLYTKISEAKISMIQDVTAVQGGVSQTVFNYGTVLIQTAAEIPVIKVERVPNPNLVIKVLQQMRGEEEQEGLEGRLK
jgi:hypothetical protein